jgi:hypothetical protein
MIYRSTKSKYRAVRTKIDGIAFDSKKEARRYLELKLLEKAHQIENLQCQVRFPIVKKSKYGKELVYVADFTYLEDGKLVVEDTKSSITKKNPVYRLKRRLMQEVHGITIRET